MLHWPLVDDCLTIGGMPITRLAERWVPRGTRAEPKATATDIAALQPALVASRAALRATREVSMTRNRGPAATAERALVDARACIDDVLRAALQLGATSRGPELVAMTGTCIHLITTIDAALRMAERGLEWDFALCAADARTLDELFALLDEGLSSLLAHVAERAPLHLFEVRAREIRLNAIDTEVRRLSPAIEEDAVPYHLWFSELVAAYETVGNQLYRVSAAFVEDDGDALS